MPWFYRQSKHIHVYASVVQTTKVDISQNFYAFPLFSLFKIKHNFMPRVHA